MLPALDALPLWLGEVVPNLLVAAVGEHRLDLSDYGSRENTYIHDGGIKEAAEEVGGGGYGEVVIGSLANWR